MGGLAKIGRRDAVWTVRSTVFMFSVVIERRLDKMNNILGQIESAFGTLKSILPVMKRLKNYICTSSKGKILR